MKKSYLLLVLIFILSFAFTGLGQTESPAEKRAKELVQIINSGNRAEFQKYVEGNFGTEMLGIPMDRHLNFFSSVYDASRGYEISGVQETKPNEATLLVKNKLTGEWDALAVVVEAESPHRIAGIGFRSPKLPDSEKAKKLSQKEITREMDGFMKKLADADVFSGTVLMAKDGVPIYKAAFGMANKDFAVANKIDTKLNLGSMNKMFTTVSIAQLVEKGKLSFDDPLSKFIPDFPDAESAKKIKIKHLLTHTAGLGGYFSEKWNKISRAEFRTVDDMMKMVKEDEKLLFEPGSRWQYSNTGMLVLGKVLEIVSGQSYFDYVRENIYKPAGMINTGCFELDKVNENLAVGYIKDYTDKGITFRNNIFMHVMRGGPQGGCYSTVEDLLKFSNALQSNKLVGADYVKTLTTAKPELNSPNYGYGFQIGSDGKNFGHGGGFSGISSNLTVFPETGWTIIVMSNYSRGGQPVTQKMQSLIEASSTDGK